MTWSSEATIAIVGVLVNVPAFCLVIWQVCRRRSNTNTPVRSPEDGGSDVPLLAPQHFTFGTEYAVALPLVSFNMTRQAGRQ
ncbi:hypothetical protein CEP54_005571 [Fusarium duplospermum]|uniref:Uncharacterized protein n=1 Tax=Fusarium duplospermum TaxID=1325734 RepID=A0A428QBK5_9HYPO|nr:hypothetical protein CEP54_005571 [Fusarium duplospermum]